MKKFELIEKTNLENFKEKIYSNGHYQVVIRKNLKHNIIDVVTNIVSELDYIPHIFIETDVYSSEYIIKDITIGTTSYGVLTTKEVEKIIESYNIAVKTVKELKSDLLKKYIKEE